MGGVWLFYLGEWSVFTIVGPLDLAAVRCSFLTGVTLDLYYSLPSSAL